MNTKKILLLTVLLIAFLYANSQNLSECKVDFFLLESQETFNSGDVGKEFIINLNNVPRYDLKNSSEKSEAELNKELSEKLKDNKDYNKNDPKVRDSLNSYYSALIDGIGVKLLWWEYIGESDKKEQKEFNKQLTKKSISYKSYEGVNKQTKYTFLSDKYMSIEEFNIFKYFFQIDNLGYNIVEYNYTNVGGSLHELWNYFDSIERALERFNFWKTRPIVLLYNEKKYKMHVRKIPLNNPIFFTQHFDSVKSVNENYKFWLFPYGCQPIFNLNKFNQSKISYQIAYDNPYASHSGKPYFLVDDSIKLTVLNCKHKQEYNELFYDKKRLEKIGELFGKLKSANLTIFTDGEEFVNPQIQDFSFEDTSITVSFINNDKHISKTFKAQKDHSAKLLFLPPIYYTDCYNDIIEAFNNLQLSGDYFKDPSLKSTLANALASSPDWMNYKIEKIILTRKSQWVIVTNKYTGLKERRFLLADVYVKSTWNDKCFYQKDVYFTQNADPIEGFIYSLFVSLPQTLQPYPCNLK